MKLSENIQVSDGIQQWKFPPSKQMEKNSQSWLSECNRREIKIKNENKMKYGPSPSIKLQ